MKKDQKASFIWIPLGILLVVSMGWFLFDLVLACVNYAPERGVFSSRFVGFANFDQLFAAADFPALLGNSLTHSMLHIVCALLFGAPLALVLGFIPNRHVKAGFAGAALVIALLPEVFWVRGVQNLLPADTLNAPDAFLAAYMLCRLAPMTAMTVFAGLALHLAEDKNSVIGALTVGLLPLLTLFTPETGTASLLQTADNCRVSDTLYTAAVRIARFDGRYSLGEAMTLTGICFNLLAGIGFVFALGAMISRKNGMAKSPASDGGWFAHSAPGLAGAAAAGLTVLLVWALSNDLSADKMAGLASFHPLGAGMVAAALAFGACMLLFAGSRYCRSGFGIMFIIFLLMQMSASHVSHHLAAIRLGISNITMPAALGVFTRPLFITVLAVLMACRPTTGRQLLFTSGGAACIAAAITAGDWITSAIYTINVRSGSHPLPAGISLIGAAGAESFFLLITFIAVAILGICGAMLTFAGLGGTQLKKEKSF